MARAEDPYKNHTVKIDVERTTTYYVGVEGITKETVEALVWFAEEANKALFSRLPDGAAEQRAVEATNFIRDLEKALDEKIAQEELY